MWQVVYVTFEMATIWSASGIFIRVKPQFFLMDTLDDLEYLTSLWLRSHPSGFVYLYC